MARTALSVQTPTSLLAGALGAGAAKLTFTAADVANSNSFPTNGTEYILAWNTHATNAYTVTINSVPDPEGRSGDIATYSLNAGEIHAFGKMQLSMWRQVDGNVYLQASNASVQFAIVRF